MELMNTSLWFQGTKIRKEGPEKTTINFGLEAWYSGCG
jgi:hypothetical protein